MGTNVVAQGTRDDVQADNAHLIRLGPDTAPEAVIQWMDCYRIGVLQEPAPAGFLGGVNL